MRVERRAERPFLPVELLALPPVRYAVLTVVAFASAMFAMVFYLPVYLQLTLHSNPAEAGLLLLPLTAGIVAGSALTGRIIVWTGRPTAIPKVGLLIAAAALFGLALLPPARPLLIGLEIATGFGLGTVMSVMQIVTQTAAGPARLGAAASTVSLARTLGSSIGASAFGALIYGVIGGAPAIAGVRSAAADARIEPPSTSPSPARPRCAWSRRGRRAGCRPALRRRADRHGAGCRVIVTGCSPGITISGA